MMKSGRSRVFLRGAFPQLDDAIAANHPNLNPDQPVSSLVMPGKGLIGITGRKKPNIVVGENGQIFERAEPIGGF